MEFKDTTYHKSERIATITYNRPEKMNAWTPRMFEELHQAIDDAEKDLDIGAIIITGAGRAYCSGADMSGLNRMAQAADQPAAAGQPSSETQIEADGMGRFAFMLSLKKPIIAAINGPAVGMGFANALYCDIRIASEKARMGLIFPRRGLAIEFGSSWLLPRIVGLANAVDLALTGRLIDAQEALRMGLVSRVVADGELMPAARALAADLATQCSPLGISYVKRFVYQHLYTDLATALRDEADSAGVMLHSQDFKEGVKAFLEKRAPKFTGR
ncbi:MAG: enoyl-CoA hydratase/isomerase family protein [Deltaproteobacteria bacterium]|nr:enoyl-CoA hydratase/isomerase family protein [Deltaproteobacteria bacterium]